MEKLDENYLDLVRQSLYKKQSEKSFKHNSATLKNINKSKHKVVGSEDNTKNTIKDRFKTKKEVFKAKAKLQKALRKNIKQKQVTFIDLEDKSEAESNSPEDPHNEVKNRVPTPFKKDKLPKNIDISPDLNKEHGHELISQSAKQLTPTLQENDQLTFYPLIDQNDDYLLKGISKQSNKRLLPESDSSPEINIKKKKHSFFERKGKKLVFDNSSDDVKLHKMDKSPDIGQKKIIAKKRKIKSKSMQWEKKIDADLILDTSSEGKTELNLNNTWDNFVYSCTNNENQDYTKKQKNKSKNKIVKNKVSGESKTLFSKKSKSKSAKISKSSKNENDELVYSTSSDDFDAKQASNIKENSPELSHSFDNEAINVRGFKFQRFCNLFVPTYNEQVLGHNTLNISKKYYNISGNDLQSDWQSEEISNSKSKKRSRIGNQKKNSSTFILKNKDMSGNNVIENDSTEEVSIEQRSHLENSQNKNKQKEKINILDMHILNSSCDLDQNTMQNKRDPIPKVNSQENLQESTDLNEICEEINVPEIQDTSENSIQPVILALNNGNKIVALNFSETTYFHGLCSIKVIYGEVEILGATINSNSEEKNIYSPRGTALLYLRNKTTVYAESSVKLRDLISEELLSKDDVELEFQQHYAIFLCSELKESYISFIEKHISQKIFPEPLTHGPRVDFQPQGIWNKICSSEKWDEVLKNISEESKTVISGGKGVGKSTFLQYTINFLLMNFKRIRVIDLDPGQSEFYSPGCISVVTVDKEVFGPNYTHLLKPESLVLSHINMGHDIKKYLQSVRYLLEATEAMEVLPTLINFPGFTQGLGLDISVQSLNWVQPSLVIQINSKNSSKNYKIDLTADNVTKTLKENNIISLGEFTDSVNLSYDFVKLESLADSNEAWSLEARQAREINILSYFGQMMSESVIDLTSSYVNMYSISISTLSITNGEGKVLSPTAVNANLVALCSTLDIHSNIFSCHGYGFVRGIDLQADTLILVTPESVETLENVSHLVLSSVTTPPSLIMTASGVKGHIPYVSVGDPVDFGQFTRRSYLPPRK